MNQPPVDKLLETVDNRYTLVVAASRRARRLLDGEPKLVNVNSNKPVTIALNEIAEKKVVCRQTPPNKPNDQGGLQ